MNLLKFCIILRSNTLMLVIPENWIPEKYCSKIRCKIKISFRGNENGFYTFMLKKTILVMRSEHIRRLCYCFKWSQMSKISQRPVTRNKITKHFIAEGKVLEESWRDWSMNMMWRWESGHYGSKLFSLTINKIPKNGGFKIKKKKRIFYFLI